MSLFVRSLRRQAPKIQASWYAHNHHGHRCIATTTGAMDLPAPLEGDFALPRFLPITNTFLPSTHIVEDIAMSPASIGGSMVDSLQSLLGDLSTWLIKRTYQPSIIRKRRKHGFRRRKESVGGRRILKRRMAKGRKRLGGC
mmetsp:Transcript_34384/g.58323  ORF Transcript_34384/g.58323 Transcript_34384/m.58323 type:complete len:141 (-) Transcript_34384:73-495(-)